MHFSMALCRECPELSWRGGAQAHVTGPPTPPFLGAQAFPPQQRACTSAAHGARQCQPALPATPTSWVSFHRWVFPTSPGGSNAQPRLRTTALGACSSWRGPGFSRPASPGSLTGLHNISPYPGPAKSEPAFRQDSLTICLQRPI